jgi:undecaprenyl-diphosphatase
MGILQALALSPGVSRSGVTITGGRWLGFERDAAARLSFLMAIPITGGAALFKGAKLAANGLPPGTAAAFFWGIVASAVTGLAAVWLVLRVVRTRSFLPFVVYRVLAGLAVLAVLASPLR